MSRVIWKGSISFGLLNVPVALYSGEQRNELSLAMLDRRDFAPVGYKRYNKATGKDVPWDEIVKGYEYEKDQYVVLGEEEFRRANVKATQSIDIVAFVNIEEIPLMYYDRPYYLEPIQKGEKGYVLLREILTRTGKVGVAKVVLRNRQHLAALIPYEDFLILELLRYSYELRKPEEFKAPKESLSSLGLSKKEIEMGERLIEGMVEEWDPEKYHDEYRDDLLKLIDEKVKAGNVHELEEPTKEAKPKKADVIDLMSLLKRSIEETEKSRGKGKSKASTKDTTAKESKRKPAARKRA